MNYYYLAAILPSLSLNTAPEIGFAEFSELCREHLSAADFETFRAVFETERMPESPRFLHELAQRERQFHNAVVRSRTAPRGRDAAPWLLEHEGFDTYIEKTVSDAFAKGNPLERELSLDRFRWTMIEELAGFDAFSFSAIIAYGLKLRIAERYAALDEQRGRDTVDDLLTRITAGELAKVTDGL